MAMGSHCGIACAALVFAGTAAAATYELPAGNDGVVGLESWETAAYEDTFVDLARRHGVGYDELRLANPGIDPWLPGAGTPVLLPTRYVLPAGPREGIVINLAEMRLYYFPPRAGKVMTYAVSVGREGKHTPLMHTRVVEKLINPVWRPTPRMRREYAAEGETLPESVPPGPDNPLGPLALRLGRRNYLIHGTSKPFGIGIEVTRGCLRLYPEDMEEFFAAVAPGTPVRVVDQPWKTGWDGELLYFEVHTPEPAELADVRQPLRRALRARRGYAIDWDTVAESLAEQRGLPQPVLRQPEPGDSAPAAGAGP